MLSFLYSTFEGKENRTIVDRRPVVTRRLQRSLADSEALSLLLQALKEPQPDVQAAAVKATSKIIATLNGMAEVVAGNREFIAALWTFVKDRRAPEPEPEPSSVDEAKTPAEGESSPAVDHVALAAAHHAFNRRSSNAMGGELKSPPPIPKPAIHCAHANVVVEGALRVRHSPIRC